MIFFTPSGIQHFVIFAAQPYGLPLKEVTIAQYLKTLGYKTHAVGKVSVLKRPGSCSFAEVVTKPLRLQLLEIKMVAVFVVVWKQISKKAILSRRYRIHARETMCDVTKSNTPTVRACNHSISLTLSYTECALGQVLSFFPSFALSRWYLGEKRMVLTRIRLKIMFFSLLTVASRIFYKGIYAFISGI